MRRYIQKNVEDVIAERIIGDYEKGITAVSLGAADDGTLTIECI